MRLLVANANTTQAITDACAAAARHAAAPGTEIIPATPRFGPAVISTRAENAIASHALLELLAEGSPLQAREAQVLHRAADCQLHLPAKIGDYTDFYVGIEHAQNVGKLFRPDNPLLPNYKYVPIGYHGRASTVRPSGVAVRRPKGQTLPAGQSEPTFGPCARLDYELELGIWIGQGNAMGEAIAIGDAAEHIAGFCLLNDWSARDIQAWEYQPLGPFLSKSFITSISPWVVTAEALEPFRKAQAPRPEGDPQPLSYLLDKRDQNAGALDIELEVLLTAARPGWLVPALAAGVARTDALGRARLELQGVRVVTPVMLADTPGGLVFERRYPHSA